MCAICVDINKGKMTVFEAFQNLAEIEETLSEKHYEEVLELLSRELNSSDFYDDMDIDDDIEDENDPYLYNGYGMWED